MSHIISTPRGVDDNFVIVQISGEGAVENVALGFQPTLVTGVQLAGASTYAIYWSVMAQTVTYRAGSTTQIGANGIQLKSFNETEADGREVPREGISVGANIAVSGNTITLTCFR